MGQADPDGVAQAALGSQGLGAARGLQSRQPRSGGKGTTPQRVRPPPAGALTGVGRDEGHTGHETFESNLPAESVREHLVVATSEVDECAERPALLRHQLGQDLVPEERTDVSPAGRRHQLGQSGPSTDRDQRVAVDTPGIGVGGEFGSGESEILTEQNGGLPAGGETRGRQPRIGAARQHQVAVTGKTFEKQLQQFVPGRSGREPVHVVEHETDLQRSGRPHGVPHEVRRSPWVAPLRSGAPGQTRQHVTRELRHRRMPGGTPNQHVQAPRRRRGADGLREQGRLTEPRAGHDGDEPMDVPVREHVEQPRP